MSVGEKRAEQVRAAKARFKERHPDRDAERARAYRARNPERVRAQKQAERAARHEEILAREREAYARNKEALTAAARERRQRDPSGQRAAARRWSAANPTARKKHDRVSYARRRGLRARACEMAHLERDPCAYCGGPADTIDHIDSISRGGSGDWTNLTAACGLCNSSKVDDSLLLFLVRQTTGLNVRAGQ